MPNYVWIYNLTGSSAHPGGFFNRGFSDTFLSSTQQNPSYDPSLEVPDDGSLSSRPPHFFPAAPPVDPGFKPKRLFPYWGEQPFAQFIASPRVPELAGTYPGGGERFNGPTVYISDSSQAVHHESVIYTCPLFHIGGGGHLFPDGDIGDELEYPPHEFWSGLTSCGPCTLNLTDILAELMYWYPLTTHITLQPTVQLAIGDILWSCMNPDDGFIFHVDTNPDSPGGAVPGPGPPPLWDYYSYTDNHFFEAAGTYPKDSDNDLISIAKMMPGEDNWAVEPTWSVQDGIAAPEYSNTYLLRPETLEWNNADPANTANSIMWLPQEVDSITWSCIGAYGRVTLNSFAVQIEAWQLIPSQWMAVL